MQTEKRNQIVLPAPGGWEVLFPHIDVDGVTVIGFDRDPVLAWLLDVGMFEDPGSSYAVIQPITCEGTPLCDYAMLRPDGSISIPDEFYSASGKAAWARLQDYMTKQNIKKRKNLEADREARKQAKQAKQATPAMDKLKLRIVGKPQAQAAEPHPATYTKPATH